MEARWFLKKNKGGDAAGSMQKSFGKGTLLYLHNDHFSCAAQYGKEKGICTEIKRKKSGSGM